MRKAHTLSTRTEKERKIKKDLLFCRLRCKQLEMMMAQPLAYIFLFIWNDKNIRYQMKRNVEKNWNGKRKHICLKDFKLHFFTTISRFSVFSFHVSFTVCNNHSKEWTLALPVSYLFSHSTWTCTMLMPMPKSKPMPFTPQI